MSDTFRALRTELMSGLDELAARPLLEKVARMGDRIGHHTVGEVMAISNQAAAWLEANPPGQPVAIEPRGCPTPGACSCVEPLAQPEPEGPMPLPGDTEGFAEVFWAQPVAEEPTDDEIEEWADACSEAPLEELIRPRFHGWRRCFTAKEFSETIRAALARWGRPTPQPVAVSERLPGAEDCIKRGNDHWCWGQERSLLTGQASAKWRLMRVSALTDEAVNWLPFNALPLPQGNDN